MKSKLNKKEIASIFESFEADNPNPKIELEYSNVFTLLIAVLLSAQTTDKAVNLATKDLFAIYNTPQKMLALGSEGVEKYIKKIGLYKNKAKNIIGLCKILIDKHNGSVPENFEGLINLPGVGRKTADVVLNSGFGQPRIGVDRHIYRIVHRIGFANGKDTDTVADNLIKVVPKKWHSKAHHWLVLHGRYICKANKPKCHECLINKMCLYNLKNNLDI